MKESIAAIVNDDPITLRELDERLSLVIVSSQLPNRSDIKNRLKPQILDQLIEEQLKLQEAQRNEITVTQEDIEGGINSVAQSNELTYQEFLDLLKRQGVKLRTLKRQVKSQIAWSQVIGKKIRPSLNISDQDVEAELSRLQDNVGKEEFLLAEIYLPFNQGNTPEQVETFSKNLVTQMTREKVPFQRIAQQFSQSAAAARGGDLGWVQEGQLPAALDNAIKTMNKGTLSQPIRTLNGYHILLLRNKRKISDETMPSAQNIRQGLSLERLERQQKRLLLDLRASAFIDIRA